MTLNKGRVVKTSSSHRWGPGLNPRSIQIYPVLMQQNWRLETMEVVSRVVSWWGGIMMVPSTGSSRTLRRLRVSEQWNCCVLKTFEDGWWFSSTACVEICWRLVHQKRGVGLLGGQGSYLATTKLQWDGSRMGWDGGWFCQRSLPSPPIG